MGEVLIQWKQGGRRGAEGDEKGEGNGKQQEAMYRGDRGRRRDMAWATSRESVSTHTDKHTREMQVNTQYWVEMGGIVRF